MPSCSGARQPLLLYKEALLLGKLTWPRCCCCMETTQEPPNSSTPGPFDGPQWPHQAPRAMYLAVAVLMGLVVASASVLNGLVIVVSIRHKRLRSPLNYILVNLAVANLLVTLCGSSVSLSNNISGFFVFGERLCQLEGFMVSLTGKGMGSTPALVLLGLALEGLWRCFTTESFALWNLCLSGLCQYREGLGTWLALPGHHTSSLGLVRVGNATWGHGGSLFGMHFMGAGCCASTLGAGCAPGTGNCTKPLLGDTLLLEPQPPIANFISKGQISQLSL